MDDNDEAAITEFRQQLQHPSVVNRFGGDLPSIIQNAWTNRNEPRVHGWVYDLRTGIIKDLKVSFHNQKKLPEIYRISSHIVAGQVEMEVNND